jgi:predicted amidohydrolase
VSVAFTVACIQLTSGPEIEPNIAAAAGMIRRAKAEGAEFILTPETTDLMARRSLVLERLRPEAEHYGLATLRDLAAELGVWLLAGSLLVRLDDHQAANRSFLIDPAGNIAARYDKIHMFDVDIPDGQTYSESATYRPGNRAVVADLPWGRLGMSVCYDLRFPYLYRSLAQAGAHFLSVPSAFTRLTGQAHWQVLVRARAIETGCFVFAPAQCGEHAGGRQTYGHSLVVTPWGEVLADAGEMPGVVIAGIDPAKVGEARGMVPALNHDRAFKTRLHAVLRQAGE